LRETRTRRLRSLCHADSWCSSLGAPPSNAPQRASQPHDQLVMSRHHPCSKALARTLQARSRRLAPIWQPHRGGPSPNSSLSGLEPRLARIPRDPPLRAAGGRPRSISASTIPSVTVGACSADCATPDRTPIAGWAESGRNLRIIPVCAWGTGHRDQGLPAAPNPRSNLRSCMRVGGFYEAWGNLRRAPALAPTGSDSIANLLVRLIPIGQQLENRAWPVYTARAVSRWTGVCLQNYSGEERAAPLAIPVVFPLLRGELDRQPPPCRLGNGDPASESLARSWPELERPCVNVSPDVLN